jgi:hypothetical protein
MEEGYTNPIEICIICGAETEYRFNTHIDYRVGYVEGAGQLCLKCYYNESTPSIDQLSLFDIDVNLEPLSSLEENIELEYVLVPRELVKNTPNDMELGAAVRGLYLSK